ncbi:MAG: phosphatidylserine decarboxylase [Acidobacteriota bacterium]
MTFAREAWPFVLPFVILAAGLFWYRQPAWGGVALVVAFAVLLFFRDPKRHFDGPAEVIVAAADGVVTRIDTYEDPAMGPGRYQRVVTFLSAFDVHIQRVPADGEVISAGLKPGRKVAAFRDDAGEVNESFLTVLRLAREGVDGEERLGIRQISGLMARRVVCYLQAGQAVERGQHLGLIKFGSRVDLLIPESYEILVDKGQRMRNGETPMARPR